MIDTELRAQVRDILRAELHELQRDVSWRLGQLRDTEAGSGVVYAEDLNLADRHLLTGYTVTDDSPSAGYIAWADLHVVYAGTDYSITDGNTNKRYSWWSPTVTNTALQSSDTKPTLARGEVLVFLNSGGTATVAVSDTASSMPAVLASGAVDTDALAPGAVTTAKVNFTARDIGSVATFYGSTAPTGAQEGDLWLDTSNTLHRYESGAWVVRQDADIAQAISDAAAAQSAADDAATAAAAANTAAAAAQSAADAAQATADGSITTYYSSDPPWATGTTQDASKVGDMWFDSDTGQAYRWTGSSGSPANTWQIIEDNQIAAALAAAQTAQNTADGKITAYYQTSAPTDHDEGDLWYDTDNGNAVSYWNGSAWTAVPTGTAGLADGAVTSTKIGSGAVGSTQLAADSVTNAKIASGAVSATELNVLSHFLY
jgi:hypothetical protein